MSFMESLHNFIKIFNSIEQHVAYTLYADMQDDFSYDFSSWKAKTKDIYGNSIFVTFTKFKMFLIMMILVI